MAGCAPVLAAGGANPLADSVRAANDRFQDVAAATAEGYAPIPCASGVAGGAMGIHYVNPAYLEDDVIDIAKPEAVMYEPSADGKMTLIAVEYITTKGPAELQGHLFNFAGAPNRYGLPAFYELHVWAWKPNPTGTFADMNPDVSCDAAMPAEPRPLIAQPIQHHGRKARNKRKNPMPRFVVERSVPGAKNLTPAELQDIAVRSNAAIDGARRALRVDRQLCRRRQALLHSRG